MRLNVAKNQMVKPMGKSVRLDDEFVDEAEIYGKAAKRSTPKQIEHWAGIGRMAEDNPDLTYEFIQQAIIAKVEFDAGKATPYVRGRRD